MLTSNALRSLKCDHIPARRSSRVLSVKAKREREHEDRSRATGLTVVSGVPNKRLSIIVLVKNSAFQRQPAVQEPEQQPGLQPLPSITPSLLLAREQEREPPKHTAVRGTEHSPCNFFSVSQNFWSSVKYLSRMKTLESPRVAILTAGVGSAAPAELVAATLGHRAARDRVPRTWVGSEA